MPAATRPDTAPGAWHESSWLRRGMIHGPGVAPNVETGTCCHCRRVEMMMKKKTWRGRWAYTRGYRQRQGGAERERESTTTANAAVLVVGSPMVNAVVSCLVVSFPLATTTRAHSSRVVFSPLARGRSRRFYWEPSDLGKDSTKPRLVEQHTECGMTLNYTHVYCLLSNRITVHSQNCIR